MPRCLKTFHLTELCPQVTVSLKLLLCFRLHCLLKYFLPKLHLFRLLEKNQLRMEMALLKGPAYFFGWLLVSQFPWVMFKLLLLLLFFCMDRYMLKHTKVDRCWHISQWILYAHFQSIKNSNIVRYYYKLKELLSILIYFRM